MAAVAPFAAKRSSYGPAPGVLAGLAAGIGLGTVASRASLCRIVCLFVLLGAVSARADEVRLVNGDRITGRVVTLIGGVLLLQTPHGDLRVQWPLVTSVMIVEPIYVTVGNTPPVQVTVFPEGNSGRVGLHPGGLVAVREIVAMSRPAPPTVAYDGRVNAGIIASGGNTSASTLRFSGELIGRSVGNRVTTSATLNRSREHRLRSVAGDRPQVDRPHFRPELRLPVLSPAKRHDSGIASGA